MSWIVVIRAWWPRAEVRQWDVRGGGAIAAATRELWPLWWAWKGDQSLLARDERDWEAISKVYPLSWVLKWGCRLHFLHSAVQFHKKSWRLEAYGCCSPSAWESLVQHGHAFYTDEITLLWLRASNFGPISVFCFLRFHRFHQWYFRYKDEWSQCGLLESYLVGTREWNRVDRGQQDTVSMLICQSVDACSWVRGFLFMMFQGGLLLVH